MWPLKIKYLKNSRNAQFPAKGCTGTRFPLVPTNLIQIMNKLLAH